MSISDTKSLVLSIPPQTWREFGEKLLAMQGQRDEVIGFFFCTRHLLPDGCTRLLPRTWIVPSRECYDAQSAGGLELRQDFHQYLVNAYLQDGMDVVHIHTHPGVSVPDFSGVDDRHEAEYARFLARIPGRPLLVSGVFNQRLQHGRFRMWRAGESEPSDKVMLSATWVDSENGTGQTGEELPRFDRQRVFGSGAQQSLGRMKVGLIGCGGLGAVFAEQLGRLGVRSWVLIDPDRLDETNLNRMPFATPAMAKAGWSKVRYVKQIIKRAWPTGVLIQSFMTDVSKHQAEDPLGGCDLLVVATDNHLSRMVAQEIALRYVRPLVSLGTHIDTRDSEDDLRFYCRVTSPPLQGGWCLMCAGVIDPVIAATEAAPSEMVTMVQGAGYVTDVAAPAVYWLNSVCASIGVQAIHGALAGFVDVSAGFDWTLELRGGNWFRFRHDLYPDCLHCSSDGQWAAGPPTGKPKRAKRRMRTADRLSGNAL